MQIWGHVLHYGIIVGGLLGVAYLLLPLSQTRPLTAHDVRVAQLRAQLGVASPPANRRVSAPTARIAELLTVSLAAAAGLHAGAAALHFFAWPLAGWFLLGVALAQLLGSIGVLCWGLSVPRRRALIAGHVALLVVWLVSRLVALPGSGLPTPEPVGIWDALSVLYAVLIVVICAHRSSDPDHLPPSWSVRTWHPVSRWWLAGSVCAVLLATWVG